MNTEAAVTMKERIEQIHRNENPAVALRDLARDGCRRCYGRGHEGFQERTGRYVICKCVRDRVRAHYAEDEAPVVSEARSQDIEKAKRAIVHNAEQLQRLEEILNRERDKLQDLRTEAEPYRDKTPEEEAAELEAEFISREFDRRQDVADAYDEMAGSLMQQVEECDNEIQRLRLVRRKALSEAQEAERWCDEIRRDVADSMAEQHKAHRERMAALGSTRKRMLHKLTRQIRQQEAKVDNLLIRCGRCKNTIDNAQRVVEEHIA
jgi:hypothetical protein